MSNVHASEPLIVAHRGASKDAPENTIPAFELAWQQGAGAIEGDFHLTRDGYIVCIHDQDTKRLGDRNLVVKDSSLAELQTVDVGAHHSREYQGTTIPTIAKVFATIPTGGKIYIEVKCGKEIIPKLLEEIRVSGLKQEQVVVISFDREVIHALKALAPGFKACWLAGFKKDDSGIVTPSFHNVMETLIHIKADGFSSGNTLVTEQFVRGVLDRGFEYHVWTVDDPEEARRFKQWGALSITTNVPGKLQANR